MDLELQGKKALITGSARGIGRSIAERLAAEGMHLWVADIDDRSLASTAEYLRVLGRMPVHMLVADLATPAGARHAAVVALEQADFLDAVVICAGVGGEAPLMAEDDVWEASLSINLLQAVRILRPIIPAMRTAGRGSIVVIGSTFGREPGPDSGPYNAAKAALLNWVKYLSAKVAPEGVLINSVSPGPIQTPAWEEFIAQKQATAMANGANVDTLLAEHAKRVTAMGKFGRPEEVAAAVAFLLSPLASHIVGTDLVVDSGSTRGIS